MEPVSIRRGTFTTTVVGALVLIAAACTPPPPVRERPAGWTEVALTRDGSDTFDLAGDDDELALSAADTNVGGNTRLIAWRAGGPAATTGTACISVQQWSWPAQEGVALRVSSDGGRTRAVTVTKNVWAHATTVFNVHVWDTGRAGAPMSKLASFDMAHELGGDASSPHRICARIVGPTLSFKVWSTTDTEPEWNNAATRTVRLPADVPREGSFGVYVGHVEPGDTLRVHDIDLAEGAGIGTAPTTSPTPTTTPPDLPADEEPGEPDDGEPAAS